MPRTIKLLHVEDSSVPRRIVAKQLADLAEYDFAIRCAATEREALAEFGAQGSDLVILDYHLAEGDGLSCLRQLRASDPIVPVIAVSGEATPEIAAELLRAGADDYISKKELATDALVKSVRAALVRADGWRQYRPARDAAAPTAPEALFRRVCQLFAAAMSSEIVGCLDELEAATRGLGLTAEQIQPWFETVCAETAATHLAGPAAVRRLLRPLLLEILLRLSGDLAAGSETPV